MDLLTSKSDYIAGTIAVVSSETSKVRFQLEQANLDFKVFEDYSSLRSHCDGQRPSLILIAVDTDLTSFASRVLENSRSNELLSIPILVVSNIVTEDCIVNLVVSGASDVVSSQAVDIELLSRIKALTHRSSEQVGEREFPPFLFGVNSQQLFKSGVLIDTTSIEFKLALYLFSNPNVVHSREKLLDVVWGITVPIDSRRVDTQISRLRARLGLNGKDNQWCLVSIYVRGYMLTVRK